MERQWHLSDVLLFTDERHRTRDNGGTPMSDENGRKVRIVEMKKEN
jgi:hypothetical protein